VHLRAVPHVHWLDHRPPAAGGDLRGGLVEPRLPPAEQGDGRPLLSEHEGARLAYAGAGTGDPYHLAVEQPHGTLLASFSVRKCSLTSRSRAEHGPGIRRIRPFARSLSPRPIESPAGSHHRGRGPVRTRTARSFAITPSPTHRSIPATPRYRQQ